MNEQTPHGQTLYNVSKSLLGQVVCANDANDGYGMYGCAESVNAVFDKAFGGPIGGGASTALMLQVLETDKRFKEVEPSQTLPGDIIIFATGTSRLYPQAHGHVLIAGENWDMSNDSETATFEANFTRAGALTYFVSCMGFPERIFRVL